MKSYSDIQGDGGSHVVAQVEAQQRAIASALAGVKNILAVASGKGGVGKSTLTLALARALADDGLRVAILDADLNGPCQARMSGLGEAPWVPGENGLALPKNRDGIGVLSFGSFLGEGRPLEIESVAAGEEQVWRATREIAMLRQLLGAVDWGELDVLVCDLPPGTERTLQLAGVLGGLGPPVAFVLVTLPSEVSRAVVARSVAALGEGGSSVLGYIENMSGYYCSGCGEVRPLFPSSGHELELPCLGEVPFDPTLAELCDRGWDGSEEAEPPSFAAVHAICREITERLVEP